MSRRLTILALLMASPVTIHASPEGGPVLWVGPAAPCNFNSLAIAIAASPDGAILRLANNQDYDDINLAIINKNLTLEGGFPACETSAEDDVTVLTGAPNAEAPVLHVASAAPRSVSLRRLELRGGRRSGLEVAGALTMVLDRVGIVDSQGNAGGGLSISGSGPGATQVRIRRSTIGPGNVADWAGGGLFCQQASVAIEGASVIGNEALLGGGVHLNGCAVTVNDLWFVPVGTGASNFHVAENSGGFGGGLYIAGGSVVALGNHPIMGIRVADNLASSEGGGLYVTGDGTLVTARGIHLVGNGAGRGGAGSVVAGATLVVSRPPWLAAASSGERGLPTVCNAPRPCNRVEGNHALSTNAAAFAVHNASLSLGHALVAGNRSSTNGILVVSANAVLRVINSVLTGNGRLPEGPSELIRVLNGSGLLLEASTIAENEVAGATIRLLGASSGNVVNLRHSVVWQPGLPLLSTQDPKDDAVAGHCLNAHEDGGVGAMVHPPGFVDATAGNFRLAGSSVNVDACVDPDLVPPIDLHGQIRPFDLGHSNGPGPFDRGAHELGDEIFASGFMFTIW